MSRITTPVTYDDPAASLDQLLSAQMTVLSTRSYTIQQLRSAITTVQYAAPGTGLDTPLATARQIMLTLDAALATLSTGLQELAADAQDQQTP